MSSVRVRCEQDDAEAGISTFNFYNKYLTVYPISAGVRMTAAVARQKRWRPSPWPLRIAVTRTGSCTVPGKDSFVCLFEFKSEIYRQNR